MALEQKSANWIAQRLFERLTEVLGAEEIDLIDEPNEGLTLTTDDWSIGFEAHPRPRAWLAVDNEPDDPARYGDVRRESMPTAIESVLQEVDRSLDGALVELLRASGDPFTIALAEALEES